MKNTSTGSEKIKKMCLSKENGKVPRIQLARTKLKRRDPVLLPFDEQSGHLTHRLVGSADPQEILIIRVISQSLHLSKP
jgi:hypothetical protein